MEQFDILGMNGEPTGRTADKGTALIDGEYYLGVHAYIYNSRGEFLLQQRSYDKAFLPGGWDIVLEHVIAGETSKEGIIRGIKEEIGLSVPENDVRFVKRFFWEIYHHIIDVYFLQMDFDINALKLQSTEVIAAKVVPKDEILEMVSKMYYRPAEYRRDIALEIKRL